MSNRAAKYEQLHKSLKRHFKAFPEPGERTVLEHLVYACCLEDAKSEQADEAFAKLQQAYFDWNEVRVTTVIELGEALSSLPNATQAGHRIKRCLQSLFETRYQYDIDDMKKANLSKATEEITAWKGISPFVLNYVSQNALGGHTIPADSLTLEVLVQCEILTQAEADKKSLPGVERAIPKNKGFEFGSLLHQFAVEFHQTPKNVAVVAVFKELGVSPKAKAIEKPAPRKEVKPPVVVPSQPIAPAAQLKSKSIAVSESTKSSSKASSGETAKKADKDTTASTKSKSVPTATGPAKASQTKKQAEAKPTEVKKSETKKPDPKKNEDKTPAAKPISKATPEKPATKKLETKAKDKKEVPQTKASSSIPPAKKSAPAKKSEPPKSASVKHDNKANPAKKKPR